MWEYSLSSFPYSSELDILASAIIKEKIERDHKIGKEVQMSTYITGMHEQ